MKTPLASGVGVLRDERLYTDITVLETFVQEPTPSKSPLLEGYRLPDGRLNLGRLGDDLAQELRESRREVVRQLGVLFPRSRSLQSQPSPHSCPHPTPDDLERRLAM